MRFMGASNLDREFDGTVCQRRFKDGVPLLARFEPCPFDGVRLNQPVKLALIAPEAANIRRAKETALAPCPNFRYCLFSHF